MTAELEVKRYVDQAQVVELYLQGKNESVISKETGLKRAYVVELVGDYKQFARNDSQVKDRAREALAGLDQHYNVLIRKAYEVIDEVDLNGGTSQMLAQKTAALKLISDLEQRRLDAFHRAGLLDDEELANDVAETEAKIEAIKDLMIKVTSDCDHCRTEILKGLSKIFDESYEVVKGSTA